MAEHHRHPSCPPRVSTTSAHTPLLVLLVSSLRPSLMMSQESMNEREHPEDTTKMIDHPDLNTGEKIAEDGASLMLARIRPALSTVTCPTPIRVYLSS